MKKHSILFVLTMLFAISSTIAQRTIEGSVTDEDGTPLIGASILAVTTATGTVTDIDGRFQLKIPEGVTEVIASYTGFESKTISLTTSNVYDIILSEGISLEEIVITGQGVGIERKRLTSTVDVVTAEQLEQSPISQIDQVLQAKLPGAQIRFSSGQPGTASLIRARGLISANARSTPVIIIDGVRVDNLNTSPELGLNTGGAQMSSLADLPVESIERVEFIRGGAATTLYGADAANGVIQIFTKKGTKGAARFTAEAQVGAIQGERSFLKYEESGDIYFRTGLTQSYRAGVDGGNDNVTYNFSGNYAENDGFNDVNQQRRVGFRTTVGAKVSEALQYTGTAAFASNYVTIDYNANTSFARFGNLEGGRFGDLSSQTQGFLDTLSDNLVKQGENTDISSFTKRFQTSQNLVYTPFDGFTARLTFGLDNSNRRSREVGTNALLISKGASAPGTDDQGYVQLFDRNFLSVTTDLSLQYVLDVGEWSFITSPGAQLIREQDEQFSITTTNQTEGTTDLDLAAESVGSSFLREIAFGGIYIAENIGYRNKFFLDAAVRWDANSAFGSSIGFVPIYRLGFTYSLTDESFMQQPGISSIITQFKVRANFGQATNFPTPFARDLTFASNPYLGQISYTFGNPGSPNLGPERVDSYEAGLDLALLESRMKFRFTYYDNTTVNALFTPDPLPSSGKGAQEQNVGEVKNTGIELEGAFVLVESDDFDLTFNASLTTNSNTVTSSGGSPAFNVGGFTFLGAWVEEGQPLGYLRGGKPVFDAEGNLTDVERNAFLGDPNPDGYGNLGLNLRYKNLSFFANGDYQYGAQGVAVDDVLRYFRGVNDEGRIPTNSAAESFFDLAGVWVEDADFFKIRTIGINYRVNASSLGLSRLELGFSALNPYVTSSASFDPEITGSGIGDQSGITVGGFGYGTESVPKQFLFTLRVGL